MSCRPACIGGLLLSSLLVTLVPAQAGEPKPDGQPQPGSASVRDLTGYLPAKTLLAVELRDAELWVEQVLRLPSGLTGRPVAMVRAGIAAASIALRGLTGLGPADFADQVAPGQVVFALIPAAGRLEPLLLSRVTSGPDLDRTLERLRPHVTCSLDAGLLVFARDQQALDRYRRWRGRGKPTLAGVEGYMTKRPELKPGAGLRVYLDVAGLRRRDALSYPDEPALQFFAGVWFEALQRATRLDAVLAWDGSGFRLDGWLDSSVLTESGAALLAGGAKGYAAPPDPAGMSARLEFDRSFDRFWSSLTPSPEQRVGIDAFLGIVDLLLGASFERELLPALGDPLTVFAIRRAVDEEGHSPIDLPGFALTAPIRNAKLVTILRGFAQRLSTILSNERRQNGLVPFGLNRRKTDRGEPMLVAIAGEWRGPDPVPLACSLSPTFAVGENHVVLATTEHAARAVLDALATQPAKTQYGDRFEIDVHDLVEYLARNRSMLVLNKVLEEGVPVQKAADEQVMLCALAGLYSHLGITIVPGSTTTHISVTLR